MAEDNCTQPRLYRIIALARHRVLLRQLLGIGQRDGVRLNGLRTRLHHPPNRYLRPLHIKRYREQTRQQPSVQPIPVHVNPPLLPKFVLRLR
jgi:hypothetical protein